MNYYNEFDPQKGAWLRELIKVGAIAPGEVDERSIKDVTPGDLRGYKQCHFFAGIGVWSYALRRAGWPDDRPAWTGSCPCQGFSVAGKKKGFADERHLWPDWFRLIAQCRPSVVFGEQSASKDALAWIDLVYSDMEGTDYSVRALDICAPGFGAPHIRQRLYFAGEDNKLADSLRAGWPERWPGPGDRPSAGSRGPCGVAHTAETRRDDPRQHDGRPSLLAARSEQCGVVSRLADASSLGRIGRRPGEESDESGAVQRPDGLCDVGELGHAALPERARLGSLGEYLSGTESAIDLVGNPDLSGLARRSRQSRDNGPEQPAAERASSSTGRLAHTHDPERRPEVAGGHERDGSAAGRDEGDDSAGERGGVGELAHADGRQSSDGDVQRRGQYGLQPQDAGVGYEHRRPGPTNGHWESADWLRCTDAKWRPVEPGTFPLAHGASARVGRLRGYGDAIVAPLAQAFIESYLESRR